MYGVVRQAVSDKDAQKPIRKIDDATYGTPPQNLARRHLLRVKRWFLLDANRNAITGLLLIGCFVAIVLVGSFGPVSVQAFLTEGVSPGTVLVELLKAIVSVVVIVLSINQLVLSPGLGPVGEQQERYEQSIDLRQRVEDRVEVQVSPASPAAFLAVLLNAIVDKAEQIEELALSVSNPDLREQSDEFTNTVVGEAETVSDALSSSRFGRFEVISAALRFAISEKVRSLRQLQQTDDESLPAPLAEAFEEMNDLLKLFAVAREYLKTVYIREEYISLSEGLLYTGLPAILVTFVASQIYTASVFPGEFFGVEKRLLFVSAAVTVSLTPFVVLNSYVFRLAAMSRSTLFVGPFDARETGEDLEEVQRHGR